MDDEPDLLDLLEEVVSSFMPDAQILTATRVQEAKQVIQSTKVDLIVADQNLPDGKGHEIFQLIQEKNLKTRFVLCSSDQVHDIPELSSAKIFGSIVKPNILDSLDAILEKFRAELRLEAGAIADRDSIDFVPVRIRGLVKTQPLPCDIYVRLSDSKFVKVFNANSAFSAKDLDKYLSKSVESLYVVKENRRDYLKCLTGSVIASLSSKESSEAEISQAMKDSFAIASDSFKAIGFSEDTQQIAKAYSEAAANLVNANPRLSDLLEKIKSDPEDYLGSHSMLLSLVSCALVRCMPWASETIYKKLSLASFLHDITLPNSATAQVVSLKEAEGKFSKEEIELIRNHPLEGAALVRQITEIPPDVDNIIIQHHEHGDGTGFPNQINSQRISPLSAIFIIAHDFCFAYLTKKQNISLGAFLAINESKYNSGSFKQVLKDMQANLYQIQ